MTKRANGQGSVYKLPNGKWRAVVTLGYDGSKRIVKTKSGLARKKDALEALVSMKQSAPEIDPSIKFAEIYKLWSEPHYARIGKDTENGYRAAYKHCEALHYRPFNALRTAELQAVVDGCELARRSKADIKSLLTNLYKFAIENDYSVKNYAEFIKLPPKPKSKRDAFTLAEIDSFWQDYNNGNEFAGYILIMIYTGMRFGELATIKKENIHLAERYMIGGIKTEAGIDREIPIAEKIYPIVEKFYANSNKKLLETHEKVFYNNYRVLLERTGARPLKTHCCRHTFATLMANAEVQPAIITATAGHEDYSTTLGYTHIKLPEKLKAVNRL